MSLTACGIKPGVQRPPAALLNDCTETATELDRAVKQDATNGNVITNSDLVWKIRQLRVDLKECNADKEAIRKWYERYHAR